MKITTENIKDIKYFAYVYDKNIYECQNLLLSLLDDVLELNNLMKEKGELYRCIYIDYENNHTTYSPERTEPCPDYYGMFTLRFEKNPYETIGIEMALDDLDTVICTLINFEEVKLS